MSSIERSIKPADPWPLHACDINEVLEMAQVVRTLEEFPAFKSRHPDVRFSQISSRMLCGLYLEDMHAQAGIPVSFEHY